MQSTEQEKCTVQVINLETPAGSAQAVKQLEDEGVIIADFGSTFGVVSQVKKRLLVRELREESLTGPLARSSLFAPAEVVSAMWPLGLDAELHADALMRMTNIGFIRFPYDSRALAFYKANPEYLQALKEYCVNDQNEIQVFPMYGHPLADAWAHAHPEQPALAVRSANKEKMQEQAVLFGAQALAHDMGLHQVYVLSECRLAQAQADQQHQLHNGLTTDERGYAKGAYATYPEMTQKRWGSVPIVSLASNGVDLYIDRVGNLDPDTLIHILTSGAPGYSVAMKEGTDRDYRSNFRTENLEEESWRQSYAQTVAAACLAIARRADDLMPSLTSRSQHPS